MTDIYAPYKRLLAGEKDVPIHEDAPLPGRYRLKRNGAYLPVAIGPDGNGNLVALVDGKRADPLGIWVSCAKHPIHPDAYKFRMKHGRWEDMVEEPDRSNRPTDPLECVLADAADRINQAEEILKGPEIETELQANLARNLQAQIIALKKQADGLHETEKAPHLEECRKVDTKFRFRETLTNLAANLKLKFEAFMIKEDRRRQAAYQAEQAKLAAERAKKLEDDPIAALTEAEPIAAPPEKVQIGGGFGRKAGLAVVWKPELVDYEAALKHYSANAKVMDLILKLAAADVKGGMRQIPGFEVKEGRRAA